MGTRSNPSKPAITILGIPFDNVTTPEVIDIVEEMIESGKPHYIATANVDFVAQSHRDLELRQILFDAHLVVCDGMPLVWASKFLGNPLQERVAGSDLTPLLLKLASEKSYRVYVLGGREDIAQKALENAKRDYPGLVIAGAYSPPRADLLEMDHDGIIERIREAKPDILFVAFGCPKQEKWLSMHWREAQAPVGIGVGASIDFLSGEIKRAPVWMQRTGLEWLFRMLQEPKRLFRRYFIDLVVFVPAIFHQWRMLRVKKRPKKAEDFSPSDSTSIIDDFPVFALPKRIDISLIREQPDMLGIPALGGPSVVLDASKTDFIDSSGIGFLVKLAKTARADLGEICLVKPSPAIVDALALMKLTEFFPTATSPEEAAETLTTRIRERKATAVGSSDSDSPYTLTGELTAANTRIVWPELEALVKARGAHGGGQLAVDLHSLRFLDSSGLGILIKLKKAASAENVTLRYLNPSDPVLNVLEVTGTRAFLLGDG